MAVITIAREFGSGGAAIGARVAERLGWRYVDDDLIFLVAHRASTAEERVRVYDREAFSLYHFVLNTVALGEEAAARGSRAERAAEP